MPKPPVRTTTLDPDEKFIPHIIYMLSFVMNVGEQYTGGNAITEAEREALRKAVGLSKAKAVKMKQAFTATKISDASRTIDGQFESGSDYGGPGCPKTLQTLTTLATQWRAHSRVSHKAKDDGQSTTTGTNKATV